MCRKSALWLLPMLFIMACRQGENRPRFPGETTGIVRPQALDSVTSAVRQLNAIVQADIRDISTSYDRCEGPRTILHLGNVRSLLGAAHPDTLTLRLFGGPLPDGRYVRDSEAPRYIQGAQYLLFLFNTDWRFSPVISDYAFRIDRTVGEELLIAPNGHAVTGVAPLHIETRTRMMFIPRGLPGVGEVRVAPTPVAHLQPCAVNADNTTRCPQLPPDSAPAREFLPAAPPWTPAPPNREDIANTLRIRDLVHAIDSIAKSIGVTPGGYFAHKSRLECWDVVPVERPQ